MARHLLSVACVLATIGSTTAQCSQANDACTCGTLAHLGCGWSTNKEICELGRKTSCKECPSQPQCEEQHESYNCQKDSATWGEKKSQWCCENLGLGCEKVEGVYYFTTNGELRLLSEYSGIKQAEAEAAAAAELDMESDSYEYENVITTVEVGKWGGDEEMGAASAEAVPISLGEGDELFNMWEDVDMAASGDAVEVPIVELDKPEAEGWGEQDEYGRPLLYGPGVVRFEEHGCYAHVQQWCENIKACIPVEQDCSQTEQSGDFQPSYITGQLYDKLAAEAKKAQDQMLNQPEASTSASAAAASLSLARGHAGPVEYLATTAQTGSVVPMQFDSVQDARGAGLTHAAGARATAAGPGVAPTAPAPITNLPNGLRTMPVVGGMFGTPTAALKQMGLNAVDPHADRRQLPLAQPNPGTLGPAATGAGATGRGVMLDIAFSVTPTATTAASPAAVTGPNAYLLAHQGHAGHAHATHAHSPHNYLSTPAAVASPHNYLAAHSPVNYLNPALSAHKPAATTHAHATAHAARTPSHHPGDYLGFFSVPPLPLKHPKPAVGPNFHAGDFLGFTPTDAFSSALYNAKGLTAAAAAAALTPAVRPASALGPADYLSLTAPVAAGIGGHAPRAGHALAHSPHSTVFGGVHVGGHGGHGHHAGHVGHAGHRSHHGLHHPRPRVGVAFREGDGEAMWADGTLGDEQEVPYYMRGYDGDIHGRFHRAVVQDGEE